MTGQQAIEAIQTQAWTGCKPGLERTEALLARMGNPHRKLKFVHLAGTNGKGSTAAMAARVLTEAGYRTGLSTSPHLFRMHERMQVDGVPISDALLGEIAEQVLRYAGEMTDHPTEFELMTAISMAFFLRSGCDIVVQEVGLGGRLDSTNIIPPPEVAVITNIGLEHTAELGNTLDAIAREKAGIIKPGCQVVLYRQGQEVEWVVEKVCARLDTPLRKTRPDRLEVISAGLEGQTFSYGGAGPYHIGLLGGHQCSNAMTVLEIVAALREKGWHIPEEAVCAGLSKAVWPGRLELLRRKPDFLVDGGHNPQCLQALSAALKGLYPDKKLIFIAGVLADKDYGAMFAYAAPLAKEFIVITPDSHRALSAAALKDFLTARYQVPVTACESIPQALETALGKAGEEDVICAWGSLYSVGNIRHLLDFYPRTEGPQ